MKIPFNNAWKPEPSHKPPINSKARRTIQIFQAFRVGCPIRRSMDQSSFAAPHGFSQRITSFIACACQGIHQMPLRHLIVLIANAHPQSGLANPVFSLALEGCQTWPYAHLNGAAPVCRQSGYLLQPDISRCHRRVRSAPSSRCHAERHQGPDLKTSFSR